MSRSRGVLAVALLALGLVAACEDAQPACFEGDYASCTCEAGGSGFRACLVSQDGYGACVCDGRVPGLDASLIVDAGDAGDGPVDAGKLPFMSACQSDEQCNTGMCFTFNAKGPKCSKSCKTADECPPPSTGCNNQGVCKAP